MNKRNAYLLTVNEKSARTIFSKKILLDIGFNVIIFKAIPNRDKVLSNKISMQEIYKNIINSNGKWSYVFEDDINIREKTKLDQIIKYEEISDKIIYLGFCSLHRGPYHYKTNHVIDNDIVYKSKGKTRGLHAIGLSKQGAKELLDFSKKFENKHRLDTYMDVILEKYTEKNHATLIRYNKYDKYDKTHRGLFYQDRSKFPSIIFFK